MEKKKFTVIKEFCGLPVGYIHSNVPEEYEAELVKDGFIRAYKKGDEKILEESASEKTE
jgi:hypothetical protein